jgi:hypothetical protein
VRCGVGESLKYPDPISISGDIFRIRGRNPSTHPAPANENKSIPLSGTLKIHRPLFQTRLFFFCRDIDIFRHLEQFILQLTDRAHVSSKNGAIMHRQMGTSAQWEQAIVTSLGEIRTDGKRVGTMAANDPLITRLNHRETLFTDTQLCN